MTDYGGVSTSANLTSLQIVAVLENKVFKEWFDFTLPLSLCSVDDATELPQYCVKSNLYIHMAQAAVQKSKTVGGKMYIYYGPPYTGKSTAGKHLIRKVQEEKGDNYPSLYLNVETSDDDLYGAFRGKLSVPKNMKDDEWLSILFYHLANKIRRAGQNSTSWMAQFPFCNDKLQLVPAAYINEPGSIPPVIVIDQLNSLSLRNYRRLKRIYHLASEARVLVYILTDQEHIANLIAGLNGDKRVTPLPQRFEREAFTTQPADEAIFGIRDPGILIATGVTWKREEWTRARQHECILQAFQDKATPEHVSRDDGFFNFLVEGENPEQAMDRAIDYFGSAGIDNLAI